MMFAPSCSTATYSQRRSILPLGVWVGCAVLSLGLVFGHGVTKARAAELNIADGVVVKFGSGAQLVVRDRLSLGSGIVFTSQKDDIAGGQSAIAGDWRGIRLEKSSATFGVPTLEDIAVRYAGGGGEPALLLRNINPVLRYVQISDSSIGLRLQSASPTITGSNFMRNGIGIESDGASTPTLSNSQFSANSQQALLNRTPETVIQATANWWGHASGPKDAVGNPQGQGDSVSTGVNYGNYLVMAPLLNPSIKLSSPAIYYEQRDLQLDLSCFNATEYRIAENGGFAGVSFQPLNNGRATVTYTLSAGEGRKVLGVQYRNASGSVVSAELAGGVLLDTQPPVVTLNNPAPGSLITQPILIEAVASDVGGLDRVEIWVDDTLVATRTGTSFNYAWDTNNSTDGAHEIKVIAYDQAGRSSQQISNVTLSRGAPVPDTEGPLLGNPSVNGNALADGLILTRNGTISLVATDRSGIARIELLLDGQVVGSVSGNINYDITLDLSNVANGAHTLSLRATDSLGNGSIRSYSVIVAHGAPDAPVIGRPTNGLVTGTRSQTLSGTAQAGSQVQILVNDAPMGDPINAGSDGRFTTTIMLNAGANRLQATATDIYGTSATSAAINVTLDINVPSAPTNLVASSQAQGKVRLVWNAPSDSTVTGYDLYRANGVISKLSDATKVNTSSIRGTSYEDLPPSDGQWTYRLVSVNAAGTLSQLSNSVQANVDATAPKAISVIYQSQGKVDAATGRFGQGRVNVVLTVSEALQSLPYLAIVPSGGAPIVVDLVKATETTYNGAFFIDAKVPSGTANALFSARDSVGNRGTDIQAGSSLKIDTEGPALTGITLTPAAPIKNNTAQTLQVTFTFSKPPVSRPQIKYLLSGPVRTPVTLSNVTNVNTMTFSASFTLPGDAGLNGPETLSFSHQAQDDLDNFSNKVATLNRFQVYQGNLPPLDAPYGLTAKAQPGGKVKLSWQAVTDAGSYQIYRQAPGQTVPQTLVRNAGTEYIDQTPRDGAYKYAVATVWQANGEESLSAQSATVDVVASATAPGSPQNLTLNLTGQGIYAVWQPPLSSSVDYYNLYRASGTSISSIDGLTPLKTRIKTPQTYDTNPSATQGAYVVTSVDVAGNESAISNSAYLNASLLPVRNLRIEQIGNDLPNISWTAPNGSVAGYQVYVGPDTGRTKLTPALITGTQLSDIAYTSGERRYTVAAVDANGVEMPRSILLPNLSSQIASGLPIKRGVMNKLQVQVSNTSAVPLDGVRVVVRLPIDKNATQFKDHKSEIITLAANQTQLVPVIVGGYADLPGAPQVLVGVEIAPNEGELVKIARTQTVDVTEGGLVVGMASEEFTRGGTGKIKLSVENTSEVDVELLTATNNGAGESSELRFKILDSDNNILATQAYQQIFGANVTTLTNGMTVARIPAGLVYQSDVFNLNVPATSPNNIRVRLEVDKLRYHSGQDDEIQIAGRGSERTISLVDAAYIGEVTDVNPISSFGDQDVLITGRALDRVSKLPLPNTRLKLILNQQGFERNFNVLTDAAGGFVYTFKPTLTDSGLYKVSAVHPDITDRPEQKAFTINRVTVGPTPYRLNIPKNYAFTIPFVARAGAGTSATNLRLGLDVANQPTGQIPVGINVQLPAPVSLADRQSVNLPVIFTANIEAQPSGAVVFSIFSDEHADTPIGLARVDYTLSEAKPYLVSTPSFVETGMSQGGSQIESVSVKNNGLQDAINLRFTLTKADGSASPAWASIGSHVSSNLVIGQSQTIDLAFTPPSGTPDGVYEFKLNVVGDNVPAQHINIYVSLTQSGRGSVLFKASDIYTATIGKDGRLIPGLSGARLTIQNEDVSTITQELVTDSLGEALFENLPAGRYQFRAKASNHQEVGGRLTIKPGVTANQSVFLDYNLVTVEWSVREITIQDRYEITLNATFETDVPAAVIVIQPVSINLPKMTAGDVFYGELNLTNYGLIRANNVTQQLPQSDAYFRYEFLVNVPPTLEAKQRITIPYRIVALQSLDVAASSGTASGGGCSNYSNSYGVSGCFECANGMQSTSSALAKWFSVGGSGGGSCGSGNGGPDDWGWGGSNRGGDGIMDMPLKLKNKKCAFIAKGDYQQCTQ